MTYRSLTEMHPFHLDTTVERERANSPWVNVDFIMEGGERVSVRLPFSTASPGQSGRQSTIARAVQLMKRLVETNGEPDVPIARTTGRFGLPET